MTNEAHRIFLVEVLDKVNHGKLSPRRATTLALAVFRELEVDVDSLGELSVALVEEEEMRNLNFTFREKTAVTDVLSFEIDGVGGEMVGEVVVAPGYVGFSEGEVEELVVHGLLHLGGMDHGEDFEASEMARIQRRVLEAVRGG